MFSLPCNSLTNIPEEVTPITWTHLTIPQTVQIIHNNQNHKDNLWITQKIQGEVERQGNEFMRQKSKKMTSKFADFRACMPRAWRQASMPIVCHMTKRAQRVFVWSFSDKGSLVFGKYFLKRSTWLWIMMCFSLAMGFNQSLLRWNREWRIPSDHFYCFNWKCTAKIEGFCRVYGITAGSQTKRACFRPRAIHNDSA